MWFYALAFVRNQKPKRLSSIIRTRVEQWLAADAAIASFSWYLLRRSLGCVRAAPLKLNVRHLCVAEGRKSEKALPHCFSRNVDRRDFDFLVVVSDAETSEQRHAPDRE